MNESLAFAFGIGLLIGSFLNVVIHRLPRMLVSDLQEAEARDRYDLCWPSSHCTHCNTPLKYWHNIPLISYVFLKGRCSFCKHPISALYPVIEFLTACIWLLCAWHWGFSLTGLCWAIFTTTLLAASVIDWQTTLLPDALTQSLVWIGLSASALQWISVTPTHAILGAVAGYASLWMIASTFERLTGKQGMGAGDFKLLAGLGAWLGPLSLIPLVLMASLSGALVGLWLKFSGSLDDDGYIPFGPFLALSGILIAAFGIETLAAWMGQPFFA
jgi:leader peptidase (prepilin peptidase)/N-methyltransferase